MGFKAVISPRFGDIFRNNSTKTGLMPVRVDPEVGDLLLRAATEEPGLQITIDVENRTLSVPEIGVEVEFPLDDFTQYRFLEGSGRYRSHASAPGRHRGLRRRRPDYKPLTIGGAQ